MFNDDERRKKNTEDENLLDNELSNVFLKWPEVSLCSNKKNIWKKNQRKFNGKESISKNEQTVTAAAEWS